MNSLSTDTQILNMDNCLNQFDPYTSKKISDVGEVIAIPHHYKEGKFWCVSKEGIAEKMGSNTNGIVNPFLHYPDLCNTNVYFTSSQRAVILSHLPMRKVVHRFDVCTEYPLDDKRQNKFGENRRVKQADLMKQYIEHEVEKRFSVSNPYSRGMCLNEIDLDRMNGHVPEGFPKILEASGYSLFDTRYGTLYHRFLMEIVYEVKVSDIKNKLRNKMETAAASSVPIWIIAKDVNARKQKFELQNEFVYNRNTNKQHAEYYVSSSATATISSTTSSTISSTTSSTTGAGSGAATTTVSSTTSSTIGAGSGTTSFEVPLAFSAKPTESTVSKVSVESTVSVEAAAVPEVAADDSFRMRFTAIMRFHAARKAKADADDAAKAAADAIAKAASAKAAADDAAKAAADAIAFAADCQTAADEASDYAKDFTSRAADKTAANNDV